jgi:hypothetical protein
VKSETSDWLAQLQRPRPQIQLQEVHPFVFFTTSPWTLTLQVRASHQAVLYTILPSGYLRPANRLQKATLRSEQYGLYASHVPCDANNSLLILARSLERRVTWEDHLFALYWLMVINAPLSDGRKRIRQSRC